MRARLRQEKEYISIYLYELRNKHVPYCPHPLLSYIYILYIIYTYIFLSMYTYNMRYQTDGYVRLAEHVRTLFFKGVLKVLKVSSICYDSRAVLVYNGDR